MSQHTLEPVLYWKLRAVVSENQRLGAAYLQAQQASIAAQKKQDELVAFVAERYGFDPKVPSFNLNDDACTLTLPDQPVSDPTRS